MKLIPDDMGHLAITAHGKGWIEINGTRYQQTLLLTSTGHVETLPMNHICDLTHQYIAQLVDLSVDIVLLGCGEKLDTIPLELFTPLMINGIGFECMDPTAAARTFNVLSQESRKVGALLFLNPVLQDSHTR